MKEWVEVTYPEIVRRAVKEKAEIWWLDEVGARNASNYIRGYAPRGVTPTLPVASHHIGTNMISAITAGGKIRYHFYRGGFNQKIYIGFLTRLIKTNDKNVFVIVDNSSTHHGLLVTQICAMLAGELRSPLPAVYPLLCTPGKSYSKS